MHGRNQRLCVLAADARIRCLLHSECTYAHSSNGGSNRRRRQKVVVCFPIDGRSTPNPPRSRCQLKHLLSFPLPPPPRFPTRPPPSPGGK